MGWRALHQIEAKGPSNETIQKLKKRAINELGGTDLGSWGAIVELRYRTVEEKGGKESKPKSKKMYRVSFDEDPSQDMYVLDEGVIAADVSLQKIFGEIKLTQKRKSVKFIGEKFRVGDFVFRVGALTGRLDAVVLEVEYLCCHTVQASEILREIALILLGPLTVPPHHQKNLSQISEHFRKQIITVNSVNSKFDQYKLPSTPFTSRHRAALYAHLAERVTLASSGKPPGGEKTKVEAAAM